MFAILHLFQMHFSIWQNSCVDPEEYLLLKDSIGGISTTMNITNKKLEIELANVQNLNEKIEGERNELLTALENQNTAKIILLIVISILAIIKSFLIVLYIRQKRKISHRYTRTYTDRSSYLAGYAGKTKNKII